MTEAFDSRSNQCRPETRDTLDRCSRLAAFAAAFIAVLAMAYFGVVYWLALR